jgi:Putative Actinobacterial Holin-X, holin superfamily III
MMGENEQGGRVGAASSSQVGAASITQVGAASSSEEDARRLQSIVRDLWQHGEALVRAELTLGLSLAREELERELSRGKAAVRTAALINGLFTAGYLTLIAALSLGLSDLVQPWLTLLVASVLSCAAGYALSVQKQPAPARAPASTTTARALSHTTTAPRAHH